MICKIASKLICVPAHVCVCLFVHVCVCLYVCLCANFTLYSFISGKPVASINDNDTINYPVVGINVTYIYNKYRKRVP